jgi:hypothetical protein
MITREVANSNSKKYSTSVVIVYTIIYVSNETKMTTNYGNEEAHKMWLWSLAKENLVGTMATKHGCEGCIKWKPYAKWIVNLLVLSSPNAGDISLQLGLSLR